MNQNSAPFITIEGVDGAGKSSHLSTISEMLRASGYDILETREPGGTVLGEDLRTMILQVPMSLGAEVMLAFASRAEHLEQKIRPALGSGKAVVCDRFTDSTFAYQGAGGGFDLAHLASLEAIVHGDIQPDMTLLFDLPVEESLRRLGGTGKTPDKFEGQNASYFESVRAGYHARVNENPSRFRIIDSSKPLVDVSAQVKQVVAEFIAARPAPRRSPCP
jgi:dTMP kinase